MSYPDQPAFVAESLAAYYGLRALKIALPDDENYAALLKRFQVAVSG